MLQRYGDPVRPEQSILDEWFEDTGNEEEFEQLKP